MGTSTSNRSEAPMIHLYARSWAEGAMTMTIPSNRRLNLNGTPRMMTTLARLLEQHGPFVSRHRLMRIAMRQGLRALDADIGVDGLRRLLVEDREDAALPE